MPWKSAARPQQESDRPDLSVSKVFVAVVITWLSVGQEAAFSESSGGRASSFLWGFCQAYDGKRGEVFPLSKADLVRLRDELHVNALRFWVHPAWVGLPPAGAPVAAFAVHPRHPAWDWMAGVRVAANAN